MRLSLTDSARDSLLDSHSSILRYNSRHFMAAIRNPHDAFFRSSLARLDLARDFLEHYLPTEVVAGLDFDGLETLRDSFVDEELADHFSDLLFRVPTQDERGRGGAPIQIAVLLEHKSYPEPQVALQLLRYMVRIWERAVADGEPLLPTLSVVFYHGRAAWKVEEDLHGLVPPPAWMTPFVPQFRYHLCDLSQFDDDNLQGEAALRAMLLTLKYIARDELRERVREIALLLESIAARPGGLDFCRTLLRYLMVGTNKVTERELQLAVTTAWEEGGKLMGTIAETWIERGVQQGTQQGFARGARQELLAGIELALELRYGVSGLTLMPEIRAIDDLETLTSVRDGIRTAATPDELRRIYG